MRIITTLAIAAMITAGCAAHPAPVSPPATYEYVVPPTVSKSTKGEDGILPRIATSPTSTQIANPKGQDHGRRNV